MSVRKPLVGVSLFTCTGIGDAGFRAAGVDFVAMAEIRPDLAAVASANFPAARMFVGDICATRDALAAHVESVLAIRACRLDLVSCTAPCQGMSKNGRGTLLRNFREGRRAEMDPRNQLILPALEVIVRLRPRWVVFENVLEMRDTLIIDRAGKLRPILDVIRKTLPQEYDGEAYVVEFADYGVPQRRQRLITVFSRDERCVAYLRAGGQFLPATTHSQRGESGLARWISVADALRDFPPLDARSEVSAASGSDPFHRVPVLDPKKYEWIRHAGSGRSAFDNQCINPKCEFQGNVTHGAGRDHEGVNRANADTPLYCERCGELLPRPCVVEDDGTLRIMRGYTSAYKRMEADLPAPALTRNLSYPCSDQKVHPTQNRVLSLAEAMRLQTLDQFDWRWGPLAYEAAGRSLRRASATDSMIRLAIGESIPPAFLRSLTMHLRDVEEGRAAAAQVASPPKSEWLWQEIRSSGVKPTGRAQRAAKAVTGSRGSARTSPA